MLVKLAWRNVRRSVRDYAIYFVTLLFGVAMFYAFNSITSQSILFDFENTASASVFKLTGDILGMMSVMIACVLGFLVIYANRFIIKRRKQEFGTYLLLGMKPGQVSSIVLMETLGVGVIALVLGLVLGVLLSQGLSFVTAGLFNIPLQQYHFIFSAPAFAQTLGCFAIIFAIVALFNTLSLRRYRLINLLSARSRNERLGVRNPWISVAGFAIAIGILVAAYALLIKSGLIEFNSDFLLSTVLMLVGTFLFFWSAAGFVIAALQRVHGVYFKRLALFTMRQIAAKVNTAFLSLSLVCVMLFFSMTVFSIGGGLVNIFTGNLEEGTQFDASLIAEVYSAQGRASAEAIEKMEREDPVAAAEYAEQIAARVEKVHSHIETWDGDIEAFFTASAPEWPDLVKSSAQIDSYQPSKSTTTYGELIDRLGVEVANEEQNAAIRAQGLAIMGVSQFNAVRAMVQREPLEIGEQEFAVNNVADITKDLSAAMAGAGVAVEVGGQALLSSGKSVAQSTANASIPSDAATLIVPDSVIESLRAQGEIPSISYFNINYNVDRKQGDVLLDKILAQVFPPNAEQAQYGLTYAAQPWPVSLDFTAEDVLSQAGGMRMMITYVAIYLGFVFIITTAALLGIQQLSETSDSLPRYRVLAELGCDRRMVFGSLRTQVMVYFLAPLGLAVCHTVCAVGVTSGSLFSALGVSVTQPALMTTAFVILVYGSYLVITYCASRGVVKSFLGKKLLG